MLGPPVVVRFPTLMDRMRIGRSSRRQPRGSLGPSFWVPATGPRHLGLITLLVGSAQPFGQTALTSPFRSL